MHYTQALSTPIGFLNITADREHLLGIEPEETPIASRPNRHSEAAHERLKAYFEGANPDFSDLPFLWPTAPFYAQVLQTLLKSRYGTRLSYQALAQLAGHPKAHRAAAAAVARNRFAVAIACHRVVHASGGVGAYRWGPAKKAWLLHHEALG